MLHALSYLGFSLQLVTSHLFNLTEKVDNMGTGCSQNEPGYDNTYALGLYQTALRQPCVLPDIGIDESLLKFSGLNSNAELQSYADELAKNTPGYIEKVGASLSALNAVPNAVGLGALIISMVLELALKSSDTPEENTYSILRRVFAEEKASRVRAMMQEIMKQYELDMKDDQRLQALFQRTENDLSLTITILHDSLQNDKQMTSKGFKLWVNGAAFRIQMMIHQARLGLKAGQDVSSDVGRIETAIDQYLRELTVMLDLYKQYNAKAITQLEPSKELSCAGDACGVAVTNCIIKNTEIPNCYIYHQHERYDTCSGCDMMKHYMDYIFSSYEPVLNLKKYFNDLKTNINTLVRQDGDFTAPAAA